MADDIQFVNNNVIALFSKKKYSNQLMINIVSFLLNHNVSTRQNSNFRTDKNIGTRVRSFAIILR